MAAWLSAMVSEGSLAYRLKLDAARTWWILGLVFYAITAAAEIYGELSDNDSAATGIDTIETALMWLLLFETLMFRVTRHIQTELPMAGDVVSDCMRLAVRLYVLTVIAEAIMVKVLSRRHAGGMGKHDRGAKIAALSAVAIYAMWRFLRYRMDSYIAANPLPSADAAGDAEDDGGCRLRGCAP